MGGKSEVWLSDSTTYVNARRGWDRAAKQRWHYSPDTYKLSTFYCPPTPFIVRGDGKTRFYICCSGGRATWFPWVGAIRLEKSRPDKWCCVWLRSFSVCLAPDTHTYLHTQKKSPLSQDLVLEPYHRQSSPDGNVPLTKTHITLPNFELNLSHTVDACTFSLRLSPSISLSLSMSKKSAKIQHSFNICLMQFCNSLNLCTLLWLRAADVGTVIIALYGLDGAWSLQDHNDTSQSTNMHTETYNKSHMNRTHKLFEVMWT